MNNFDFICVSGYGKSGSGACVDLLKEFEYIDGPDREFRIAKDPYGILDLELSIIDNWEFVRHNTAINDFLKYCAILSRKDGVFKKVGKNFSDTLYVDFMKESVEYISRISDFTYIGDSLLNRYYLNELQSFKQRLKSKFALSNATKMYFSRPSEDKFVMETRQYIRNIFENYAKNKKAHKIVLDQAVSPINFKKTLKYFGNAKLIIVDRDPRDIYVTMTNEKRLLGADISHNGFVDKYIVWHNSLRKETKSCIDDGFLKNRVLRLNFEDFFTHYDTTVDSIKEFLNIDFNHTNKGSKFMLESMSDHVGIWKRFPDQNTMLYIEKKLGKYCFVD